MPVNAAICVPASGATVEAGAVPISGWAVASGRRIVRVDVSSDGGGRWYEATLEEHPGDANVALDFATGPGLSDEMIDLQGARLWEDAMASWPMDMDPNPFF